MTSTLDRRIDFVLATGAVKTRAAAVVGDEPADKTESGFWPSDHAGVIAVLKFDQ